MIFVQEVIKMTEQQVKKWMKNRITKLEEENTKLKNAYRQAILDLNLQYGIRCRFKDLQSHGIAKDVETQKAMIIFDAICKVRSEFEPEWDKDFAAIMTPIADEATQTARKY
jgi:hypothetical protein